MSKTATMPHIYRGTIIALSGSYGSGLATLILDNGQVFCENGPTVRSLDSCFGDVIGKNHTIDNEEGGHIGREIYYIMDDMGLTLDSFIPVEDAPMELTAAYEAQEETA